MFLIFMYICVRHIEIHRNVLALDALVKVCIIRIHLSHVARVLSYGRHNRYNIDIIQLT